MEATRTFGVEQAGTASHPLSSEGRMLQTEGLCLCYGEKIAIEDIQLHIPPGAVTAIIGPSGSGKSSFLCCLNRLTDLTENCRVSGSVRLGNTDVNLASVDPRAVRRRVGMVFQKANPFPFSIRKNLELPLRHHGIRKRNDIDDRIERVLVDVGLWEEVKDRLAKPALSLSGGQQQRLCIARALVIEPDIILMDEPCSALDPISTSRIEALIGELKKDYTIVIVTHNLAQARRVADYIAMFWNDGGCGRLIEHGPAQRVFNRPTQEITRAYLSHEA